MLSLLIIIKNNIKETADHYLLSVIIKMLVGKLIRNDRDDKEETTQLFTILYFILSIFNYHCHLWRVHYQDLLQLTT